MDRSFMGIRNFNVYIVSILQLFLVHSKLTTHLTTILFHNCLFFFLLRTIFYIIFFFIHWNRLKFIINNIDTIISIRSIATNTTDELWYEDFFAMSFHSIWILSYFYNFIELCPFRFAKKELFTCLVLTKVSVFSFGIVAMFLLKRKITVTELKIKSQQQQNRWMFHTLTHCAKWQEQKNNELKTYANRIFSVRQITREKIGTKNNNNNISFFFVRFNQILRLKKCCMGLKVHVQ